MARLETARLSGTAVLALAFCSLVGTATAADGTALDALIREYSTGWSLERIAPLERSILRVGLTELLYGDELPAESAIPAEGAIDEAVETAKRFCGAEAPAFVNGILGAVLRARPAAR